MSDRAKRDRVFKKRFPQLVSRLDAARKADARTKAIRSLPKQSSDWNALLDRWLEGLELKPNTAYALTGFGDGSHVAALLDCLPRGSYVFCAEQDIDSFAMLSLDAEPLKLLEDPRLLIGIGDLDADYFESLSRIPTMELVDARALVFAPLYNRDPDYYGAFLSEFTRAYEYWRKLCGTNLTESGRWQNNTFENAAILTGAPDIKELKGAFSGVPVILVSAGPSLDVSLDFVKANESRCIIVAVNSSYRALRNHGIIPHFVIAADPYEYTDRGFEGVSCDKTVLICPFIVYPKVVERFRGRVFTWSQNNLLASYLRLVTGMGMGSEIQEIGTVSACVFDLARLWGSSRIVFVGQDLAAKSDGQLHNSDSFYADLGANHLRNEDCRTLPGNVEESVRVEAKLYVYLKAFESLARKHGADIELHNTSVFGARIEGIPYTPLFEMAGILKENPTGDLASGLRRVDEALQKSTLARLSLVKALGSLSRYGKSVCQLALKGALSLEGELGKGMSGHRSNLELAESLRKDLESQLDEETDWLKVMSDGAIKHEQMLYRRSLQQITGAAHVESEKEAALREYFWAVAEGSYAFYSSAELGCRLAAE